MNAEPSVQLSVRAAVQLSAASDRNAAVAQVLNANDWPASASTGNALLRINRRHGVRQYYAYW